ncbi:unnamed protein product [Bathycoccus prasinos]
MGNKLSSTAKRKKEEAMIAEAAADMERLKLGPTKIWTGLVLHHKDVFVSHVLPKLNETDRWFFAKANSESSGVLEYAGVDVLTLRGAVYECSSISTLELKFEDGNLSFFLDQARFCEQLALTNKLEFLKWAREVKHCEWDEWSINQAAFKGNLDMLKYCFSNDCPCDEKMACGHAAIGGHLDCLRFLFAKVKPSRDTEEFAAQQAAACGRINILKYLVEERKISAEFKNDCVYNATGYGRLDCLQYLVEEAKAPLNDWQHVALARYKEHPDCENYLLEKGCPEPTDEQYAKFVEDRKAD